ncbi:MAG: cytochrome c [Betaproteobacteria bacterium]|nr:cytochrome c [Betaproteobacteria bacterium]
MKKFAIVSALAALSIAAAHAQVKPEDAIAYRQGAYSVIKWNFAPMAAMVKGEKPYDKAAFARHAEIVEYMGKLTLEGFIPGSDKGGNTKVKPEAFAKMDDFKAKMKKMNEETAKLAAVAKTGSFDDIKKQFGATGASCKACHDDYKNK